MRLFWRGSVTAPLLGALWLMVLAITLAVAVSFGTGDPYRPILWLALLTGAVLGAILVALRPRRELPRWAVPGYWRRWRRPG